MPQLQVMLRPSQQREVVPGELALDATFTNASDQPATLNLSQASHPALTLEVQDGQGRPVYLAPPSAPDAADLAPGARIDPGQSVNMRYAGFLDRDLPAGAYRLRYASPYPPLGGRPDDPLVSDWVEITIRPSDGFVRPGPLDLEPRPDVRPVILAWLRRWWHWIWCFLAERILHRRCDRVLTREVDEARTETISNAPAGSEAWNGTYSWRARFLATVDQPRCTVTALVRVRLVGTLTDPQRTAWRNAIQTAWGNRFKLCCFCCCCRSGYAIRVDIQFVTSGEHQVVNVGTSTTNMGNWGAADTVDVSHEYGHMLGALDEYFTVNGTNYGAGRQPGGNIMNNPANQPAAHHYELICAAARELLDTSCTTRAVTEPC
jgi:hypothetical protein